MKLGRVVVNADMDKNFDNRSAFAAGIAKKLGTQVTGVFARLPQPVFADAAWPAVPDAELTDRLVAEHEKELDGQVANLKPRFEKAAGDTPNAWLEVPAGRVAAMLVAAQAASFVVVAQPDRDDPQNHLGREEVSDIVMRCGRPVLFHPYIDAKADLQRILVAWDGSRESVRALNDAAPFFDGAHVLFLTAAEGGDHKAVTDGEALVEYAESLGATATYNEQHGADIRVSDALMSRAADYGADLVVMGGYSHSRFREVILGGTTRQILEQMPVPVLMSH